MTHPSRWLPLAGCCLGTFLLLLYTTVLTVALPRIGADLHAGFGARQWILDGYTVALAGLLLGAGSACDVLGARRVYVSGLAGFTVATAACGLAGSAPVLVAARLAQGVAGAAMFAAIPPLLGLAYSGRARATAFAVWSAVAGAAAVVGTVGGGLLAQYAGWRWTFLGALPLCAAALLLAGTTLPPTPRTPDRIDWPGTATLTVAITALTYTVISSGEAGATSGRTLAALAVAVTAGAGFVLVQRVTTAPVLPPALFATRRFAAVLLVAFGYYFGAFGALPGISAWLQSGPGLGSLPASLVLAVQLAVFIAVTALVSGRLHGLPPRWTLGTGTATVGLAGLTGLTLAHHPGWYSVLPFLVLSGLGGGVVAPLLQATAISAVPPRFAGTAGAATNAARQLGLTLGIAACDVLTHPPSASGVTAALLASGLVALVTTALSVRSR